jgi:hypothetical protein
LGQDGPGRKLTGIEPSIVSGLSHGQKLPCRGGSCDKPLALTYEKFFQECDFIIVRITTQNTPPKFPDFGCIIARSLQRARGQKA